MPERRSEPRSLKEPAAAPEVELVAEPAVAVLAQEPVAALVREPVPVRAAPVVLLVAPVLAAVVQVLPVLVEAVPVAARRIARQRGVPDRADELAPARRCCSKKGNLAERPLNGKSGAHFERSLNVPHRDSLSVQASVAGGGVARLYANAG